jgi:DNA-binding NtrC family response regulator
MGWRVLIVDDDRAMCELIEADLTRRDFDVVWHTSAEEGFASLRREDFDVVLTDLNMPQMNGIELCERIVADRPDVPVIVITAFGSLETAVAAIRAGAYDFVSKPIEVETLTIALERAAKHRALQGRVKMLSEVVGRSQRFGEMLGESLPMQKLYQLLGRVADSEASVLITGESGTGKELVARALHDKSPRREGPFVPLSCAAMPGELLESELFGHTRGAFTDARSARKGLFLEAETGTLFLDEIGDLPLALQPKLLRALEEQRIRPLGADREVPFDVRVIAATNRDLESAVDEGRFREDLFFRINVIKIEIPPLRARGTDILLLAEHFLQQFAARSDKPRVGISTAVAEKLMAYSWPGNVRELRNAIERATALGNYEKLAVEDLPERIRAHQRSQVVLGGDDPTELVPMEEVERRYILHVLEAVGGNRTLAARVLGLDRKTLYRKLLGYEKAEAGRAS